MNTQYTDSRYTFTSPNANRKYIKTLAAIAAYNARGILPDRALIAEKLGEPDPTEITGKGWRSGNIRRNWGNSRWNALAQAGLIVHRRTGNRVHYTITGAGLTLLKRTVNNI